MSATVDTSFFGIHEDIILTKEGVWLSNGEEITHSGTVNGFSRNLFRSKDGFEIRLGNERKTIHVEDTIYFIHGMAGDATQGFTLRLNDGRVERLDPSTLQYRPGRLTCLVPHPTEGTREEAKFLTTAYYELLKQADRTPRGIVLRIGTTEVLLSEGVDEE